MFRFSLVLPGTDYLSPLPLIFFIAAISLVLFPAARLEKKAHRSGVLLLVAGMFLTLSISFYDFIVDDVYISLRYARNLAEGHGLVFNTDGSTPVEGYTNFLWVMMEAPLFMMKLSDETILHIIRIAGIILGWGVILLTYKTINLLTDNFRSALIGAIFLAAVPEFAFWCVGGLETSMYMFWMMLGLYYYLKESKYSKPHIVSMIMFCLMAITRPEGLVFASAVMFIDFLRNIHLYYTGIEAAKKTLRYIVIGALVFSAMYSVYFLWRFNYYGLPLPNTYYAKKIRSTGFFIHRLRQVSGFFIPLFPFFAVALLGYFQLSKNKAPQRLLLACLLILLVGFSFLARNEWMPGFRYEVPVLPLLMVFFSVGITTLIFSPMSQHLSAYKVRIGAITVSMLFGIFLLFESRDLQKTGNLFTTKLERAHVPLGKWLQKYAPADASYASWDMGAVPYYSRIRHVVDINSEGLLNPHTPKYGYDIDRFLVDNPTFLVLPPNTDYVRPAEIRKFYLHKKVINDYEFLFSFSFDKDYLLNVYKNKNVPLSESAILEGRKLALQSRLSLE